MPKIGTCVKACVEYPELGEYDRRTASQPPTGKMIRVEGHAHVIRENKDGSIDVSIYDSDPDEKVNGVHVGAHIVCGGSNLKQGPAGQVGCWWME